MRDRDLKWYQENRKALADEFKGQWIVVLDKKVLKAFPSEIEAIEYAFDRIGDPEASVFQAVSEDPYIYIG